MLNKSSLRRQMRERRQQLTASDINQASQQVAAQLCDLAFFQQSRHIAAYIANDGELDPAPLVQIAQQQQKCCYLPVMQPQHKTLRFFPYTAEEPLMANHLAIMEPSAENKQDIAVTSLDLVLVPLVAFDDQGNRLGRGAGYYDITFAKSLTATERWPTLVGLAYDFQRVAKLPHSSHDVPLHYVITPQQVLIFGK